MRIAQQMGKESIRQGHQHTELAKSWENSVHLKSSAYGQSAAVAFIESCVSLVCTVNQVLVQPEVKHYMDTNRACLETQTSEKLPMSE